MVRNLISNWIFFCSRITIAYSKPNQTKPKPFRPQNSDQAICTITRKAYKFKPKIYICYGNKNVYCFERICAISFECFTLVKCGLHMCGCVCVVAFSWQFEHSERKLHLNILVLSVLSVRHLIFVTCYNSFTANFTAAFLVFELQTNGLFIVFPSLIGFVIFVPDKV